MRRILLTATATCAVAAGPVLAEELTVATWTAPSHPTYWAGFEPMFSKISEETDGELTFNIIAGGALMSGQDTLTGLGDGIADASLLATTYNPAQLPAAQIVGELSMMSGNTLAVAAAVTEFMMLECEPCKEQFAEQNVVYTGSYATAPYALISKTPIETPEDLKGKRVRTPGGAWDRFVAESGGSAVHTSSTEMYEALDKGIIDVAMQPAASLKTYSLWDVAPAITLGSFGVYNSGPLLAFNEDTWAALEAEERRVILDALPEALIRTSEGYLTQNEEAKELAVEEGMEILDEPEKMETWIAEFNSADVETAINKAAEVYGVENAVELSETYRATLQRWAERVDGGMSRDEIVATLKTEVFDKIDENSYGL